MQPGAVPALSPPCFAPLASIALSGAAVLSAASDSGSTAEAELRGQVLTGMVNRPLS